MEQVNTISVIQYVATSEHIPWAFFSMTIIITSSLHFQSNDMTRTTVSLSSDGDQMVS